MLSSLKTSQIGFSIVELIVSLVIFTIISLGLANYMSGVSLNTQRQDFYRAKLDVLEEIKEIVFQPGACTSSLEGKPNDTNMDGQPIQLLGGDGNVALEEGRNLGGSLKVETLSYRRLSPNEGGPDPTNVVVSERTFSGLGEITLVMNHGNNRIMNSELSRRVIKFPIKVSQTNTIESCGVLSNSGQINASDDCFEKVGACDPQVGAAEESTYCPNSTILTGVRIEFCRAQGSFPGACHRVLGRFGQCTCKCGDSGQPQRIYKCCYPK